MKDPGEIWMFMKEVPTDDFHCSPPMNCSLDFPAQNAMECNQNLMKLDATQSKLSLNADILFAKSASNNPARSQHSLCLGKQWLEHLAPQWSHLWHESRLPFEVHAG